TCPVVGAGGCALSVSWTASEPWASLRRTRLGGSTGPSPTAFLGNGQHGALVDTLRAGDRVRYDLVGGDGTVLQSSRGVSALAAHPLRIVGTTEQSYGSTVVDYRLSAAVQGGVPPIQVEYFVDGRSLGVSKDTAHTLAWRAV